ncbi:aminotransferase class I/II-fold pyridoxal phosphate-dependent enzyme [Pedobacter sp. Leaf176]|uniref:aminotransferase class I/II-fold pyridoxal phosphate-dependent enzyme n=1 Tax=Pedobacter sp. Leaf176 TaxID=1736286 RepID=UPI0006FAF5C0|nr:aminotransferase class I/II-fold pyridoxal phosphate-dependent enzyme [Pedobacter sp. Leaf176]KQR71925.1 aminotransferase class I/II [Pedobacter sp. Leaf176]
MHSEFKSIAKPFSNILNIGGIDYLYFGGTAYLGIPQNPEFIELFTEGIKKYGLNNGTSRTNNVQLGIYDDAEKVAAHRFKAEDALITSSGYLAAQLTVKGLSGFGKVIYAPSCHPALWLDDQVPNRKPFSEWKVETLALINNAKEQNWVLISNSMNNLFPEIYDFGFLEEIHHDKKVILIVDDSHGIGINNGGLGSFVALPKKDNIDCVIVASMAKALGLDAGLVLGSSKIIQQLKRTNTFIGASPPAAAGLYTFIKGEHIYKEAWDKLQENIDLLSSKLSLVWNFEIGFPVFFLNNPELASRLLPNKILISSFPYPDANSELINRVVLSSWHSPPEIDYLASCLENCESS